MFELSLILGATMTTTALAILLDTRRMQKMFKEMLENPGHMFVMGLLSLMFGLFMLLQNHILSFDFEGLFALLGWLTTFKGLLIAWFTDDVIKFTKKKIKNRNFLTLGGFIHLILGLSLLYFVWTML